MSSWCVLSPAAIVPNSVGPAGGHHHCARAAGMHDRAHQGAAGQLGQRRPRRARIGALVDRQRLAGQHRLVAFEAGDLEQPNVGRDDVAEPQLDDVAGHQRGDVHRRRPPVTDHHCLVVDLRVQRLGGLLGPVLIDEPEPDRQGHDHADDHRVAALADEVGGGRGGEQQPQQRGAQLVPEHRPEAGPGARRPRSAPHRAEPVGRLAADRPSRVVPAAPRASSPGRPAAAVIPELVAGSAGARTVTGSPASQPPAPGGPGRRRRRRP